MIAAGKSGGHDFAMESMDGSRKVNREDSATSCTSFAVRNSQSVYRTNTVFCSPVFRRSLFMEGPFDWNWVTGRRFGSGHRSALLTRLQLYAAVVI